MASRALFSLIVVVLTIACTESLPALEPEVFAINDCHTTDGDVTLAEVEISDPGHYAGQVGVYFTYPPKGVSSASEITCVIAKDMLSGTGGDAQIVGGGLGEKYVEIHITSKARGKADFAITVKGKPPARK